ncbi:MAG TPA: hemerythrin domain-containing protein [Noviherbaspirillum sp.]
MPRNATSGSTSKTTRRAAPKKSAKPDAVRMLTDDHKKVKKMFDEFEKIKEKEGMEEQKQLLVETACAELTIHAQLEEEIFYPAARDAIEEMDLLDEAEVEHASAKQLITELSAMQPGDDLYDAKFTVLGEYVKHHVEEEEKQLFPLVKKSEMDLAELAQEMQERKLVLREELGFMADEAEEEEEEDKARRKLH